MKIKFTDNNLGVICTAGSQVTFEELRKCNVEIYKQGVDHFKGLKYFLLDLTPAESGDLTFEEINSLAEQDSEALTINPGLLLAVVGADDLAFGLARMWESIMAGLNRQVGVFRTLEEAEHWISQKLSTVNIELSFK